MKIITIVVNDEGYNVSTNASEEEFNSIVMGLAGSIIEAGEDEVKEEE